LELRGRVVTTSGGRFARVEPAEHPSGLLT
jgi:hypothetical protein